MKATLLSVNVSARYVFCATAAEDLGSYFTHSKSLLLKYVLPVMFMLAKCAFARKCNIDVGVFLMMIMSLH